MIIICTIEKANVIVNSLIGRGLGHTIGCVVIDEMHTLGDSFNGYLLELECRIQGQNKLTFDRFLAEMKNRRTSPNGVFGMQLHYAQLLAKFSSDRINNSMIDFVRDFDKHIWLRRRNKLRQAISFAIAKKNGAWSSEDEKKVEKLEIKDISMFDILSALRFVSFNDYGWECLIRSARLDVHEVWYEDLVTHYESVCSGIFNFLQINSSIANVPPPPISRQGSDLNEKLFSDALAWLGVNEEPA